MHLTILLLPIAGGTSDPVYICGHLYSIQARYTRLSVVAACVIYIIEIDQSLPWRGAISFIPPSFNDSHSTMNCVLSEELAPTPLEAVQVMVAKALSLITLETLSVLVTLRSDMVASVELVMTRETLLKSTPSMNQEMVGAGTPVAVHISAPEAPSEKVTVGFWEAKMAASGATE